VTLIADDHVADPVHAQAKAQFSDKELSDLTLAVAAINAWNRLSIAARLTPGSYQPAATAS
jgi:alkylhydroperoxidase family enzyme